jgi:hypothetical protein
MSNGELESKSSKTQSDCQVAYVAVFMLEPESDRATGMVMTVNFESFRVDGVGYDETETEPPSSTNPQ